MPSYDRRPVVSISDDPSACTEGWTEVRADLASRMPRDGRFVVAVELYPGISSREVAGHLAGLGHVLFTDDAFLTPPQLRSTFAGTLTDDPVFNIMHPWTIEAYFDAGRLTEMKAIIASSEVPVLVVGPGASHVAELRDLLLSASVSRWELQRRQRVHCIGNLGFANPNASAAELYKTAFFLDWRVGDELRHRIYGDVHLFLDLNDEESPRMLGGDHLRQAVRATVERPFRVVPFFDPGPWGGQWMRTRFGLPDGPPNYAWGFDCVPEENSVVFGFGSCRFELPAIVLVQEEPERLLGSTILQRFGREFPIRFDLLDTVGGGNLSLQVHPSTSYIREHFGMAYTQDESYYMLHSEPGSSMYLGVCDDVKPQAMEAALRAAQAGAAPFDAAPFDAAQFVASWPTVTHDHFSIPAGTVHCSGAGNVVLEISATPYIFTFKLWDWGRTGLDGHPRPIHLEHGLANICWERTAAWVGRELVGQNVTVVSGDKWTEERTGLHSTEFLETRRHWFTGPVPHDTAGNLHVLNLVQGDAAILSSPSGAFPALELHYAETVIVPAAVGAYTITPATAASQPLATLKAYVRG